MNKWDGEIFMQELKLDKSKLVLEIGVGTGRIANKIMNSVCKRFVGCDLSEQTVLRDLDNLEIYDNFSLLCGDFSKIEFSESFDIICSTLTFFHIKEKYRAIEKIKSLLNDKGRFVLSIEKDTNQTFKYGNHEIIMYPDNINETVSLLKKSGFNIKNIIETEFSNFIISINQIAKKVYNEKAFKSAIRSKPF